MDFDFSESDGESAAADAELNDMLDLVGHKCSICFTADSQTELAQCGDQFCYECLETYWRGKMDESMWGIRPATIDCPVCRAVIRENTWLMWASAELRDLHVEMLSRRPLIRRTCQNCGNDQSIMGEPVEEPLAALLETIEDEIAESVRSLLHRKVRAGELTSLLRHLPRHLLTREPTPKLVYFLRKVLQASQEDERDLFANKQLAVMAMCSGTFCDFCTARICVRCSDSDWHEGRTCIEALRQRLHGLSRDDPEYESLAWKAAHGKPCPKCFLLVTKDDDGSCNQMRCSNCGFTYCWECLCEWSSACGYYSCARSQRSDHSSDSRRSQKQHRRPSEDRTEAGIPDVTKLPSFSPQ